MFNTSARLLRHRKWQNRASGTLGSFLHDHAIDIIGDQLQPVMREFKNILCVGLYANRFYTETKDKLLYLEKADIHHILTLDALNTEEHRQFDCIISILDLHWSNHLPQDLISIKNRLKPDGLFMGVILGEETLLPLKEVFYESDMRLYGGTSIRFAPAIAIKDFGMLVQKAGFALSTVYSERLTIEYNDLYTIFNDIRCAGESNILTKGTSKPLLKKDLSMLDKVYREKFQTQTGRLPAFFDFLITTGWCPDPSQPQPLKPGSAKMSMADWFSNKT